MADNGYSTGKIKLVVPGHTEYEGLGFLESIASGNIGAGMKITAEGKTIPQIRSLYKSTIQKFEADLNAKKAAGVPAKELARWAVNERTKIARLMRAKQGGSASIVLELRDQLKYGKGGRSYDNLAKRALSKGVPSERIPGNLLTNATKSNAKVNESALKGAKFLKNGGRAVIVVSISATAYILLTAPEGKLEQILYEEAGGIVGGFAGGGAGVGLCIVFGIATSGWGLLGCGVLGGSLGGILGAEAGERVFLYKDDYIRNSDIIEKGFEVYDPNKLMGSLRDCR